MVLAQNINLVVPCAFRSCSFVLFVPQELFSSFHTYPQSTPKGKTKFQRARLRGSQGFSSRRDWVRLDVEKSMREGEGQRRRRKGKISWRDRRRTAPTEVWKVAWKGFGTWAVLSCGLLHTDPSPAGQRVWCSTIMDTCKTPTWKRVRGNFAPDLGESRLAQQGISL